MRAMGILYLSGDGRTNCDATISSTFARVMNSGLVRDSRRGRSESVIPSIIRTRLTTVGMEVATGSSSFDTYMSRSANRWIRAYRLHSPIHSGPFVSRTKHSIHVRVVRISCVCVCVFLTLLYILFHPISQRQEESDSFASNHYNGTT